MIYLIGGPPRMGKSTMAQQLLERCKFPYVSTDALTVMLKPTGQPSFYSSEKAELFLTTLTTSVDRIIANTKYDRWVNEASPEQLENLVIRIQKASRQIQTDCQRFEIGYFDLSTEYEKTFELAYGSIVNKV